MAAHACIDCHVIRAEQGNACVHAARMPAIAHRVRSFGSGSFPSLSSLVSFDPLALLLGTRPILQLLLLCGPRELNNGARREARG